MPMSYLIVADAIIQNFSILLHQLTKSLTFNPFEMATVITAKIMAGPNDRTAGLSPSYEGGIATNIIRSVKPYTGGQSGVNAVINVGYPNGRTLVTKGRYLVNESVTATITNINA